MSSWKKSLKKEKSLDFHFGLPRNYHIPFGGSWQDDIPLARVWLGGKWIHDEIQPPLGYTPQKNIKETIQGKGLEATRSLTGPFLLQMKFKHPTSNSFFFAVQKLSGADTFWGSHPFFHFGVVFFRSYPTQPEVTRYEESVTHCRWSKVWMLLWRVVRQHLGISTKFKCGIWGVPQVYTPRKLRWPWKIHHLNIISDWTWRCSNVMLVFSGVLFVGSCSMKSCFPECFF